MALSKSTLVPGQILTVKQVLRNQPLPIKMARPLPTYVCAWVDINTLGTGKAIRLTPGDKISYVRGPFKTDDINIIEILAGTTPAYIYWGDARTNME